MNLHLKDDKERIISEEEQPTTEETLSFGVPKEHHQKISSIPRNHERMWDGHLGEIKETEHQVDLLSDAKTFKSAPYREGPETLELIQT